jgi:5-methylcytosine-specific restriction endonuclease McrA
VACCLEARSESGFIWKPYKEKLGRTEIEVTTMAKRIAIPKESRDKLLVEAKHQCSKCHEKTTHIHHITSVADGGSNNEDNLIVLCPTCHGRSAAALQEAVDCSV